MIIEDENYAKKLQNCYEISVNVYLIFMNVDQKVFLGYGKVISDVYSIKHVDDLQDVANLPHYRDTNVYACKIEWVSKNSINFEYIKHIRNSHNNNQSINMCKEFNEVDDTAAQML